MHYSIVYRTKFYYILLHTLSFYIYTLTCIYIIYCIYTIDYSIRYRPVARYATTPDSATLNSGFRCAMSINNKDDELEIINKNKSKSNRLKEEEEQDEL